MKCLLQRLWKQRNLLFSLITWHFIKPESRKNLRLSAEIYNRSSRSNKSQKSKRATSYEKESLIRDFLRVKASSPRATLCPCCNPFVYTQLSTEKHESRDGNGDEVAGERCSREAGHHHWASRSAGGYQVHQS